MINLDKEVICGYEVSAQMKRIWAMELDMVEKFVAVCQEHNLMYMIMGGTLLGAVRHKGFIPWDNDIDILMPRHDFNKLMEIGPEAFKNPLFFQTPVTEESRFFSTHIKIRNGNGTAATPEDYERGINCGIFIDVFCLDEIPDSSWIRKVYFWRLNDILYRSLSIASYIIVLMRLLFLIFIRKRRENMQGNAAVRLPIKHLVITRTSYGTRRTGMTRSLWISNT